MTSQAIQAVLRKITDPDNKMSRAIIKGELESCLSSLRETTKMQDQPAGTRLSSVPYELMQAQESLESAITQLDQGNDASMVEATKSALARISETINRTSSRAI